LVAKMLPETDPIHKVTIIPRGRALGLTQQLPMDEKHTYPKRYLLDSLAVLMGGRAAEELVLEEKTSGAGNDIERATETARKMICQWGMSERLGPLAFGQKEEQIFLGREFAQHKDYSEETAVLIDQEIREVVTEAYEKAKKILTDNMNTLHALAEALLERETLVEREIEAIIAGDFPKSAETEEEETKEDAKTKDATRAPGKLEPLPS
ncbi:MAG: cell division protein FtsH, partial [Desulfobacterales bacterium]